MSAIVSRKPADASVVLITTLALLLLTLFLQAEFTTRQAVLLLLGVGLGITLLHAAFGFSSSWREFIRTRRATGIRAHIQLLVLTSILFFPLLGHVWPELSVTAALGPVGLSVIVGAFLFGVGMQLGGGCGSGTLYTVGGGHVRMLITLAFFIVGAFVATAHIDWWLTLPNVGRISSIETLGWGPALIVQLVVLLLLYFLVTGLERRRHGRQPPQPARQTHARGITNQLIFGPWPLWWGVVGLAVLNLITLLTAGHPWTITFAFGLWGAKIWTALGGDISNWTFWSSGYQAQALQQSVLADTTSLMDFGIILGAILAAALAGSFAPEKTWRRFEVITAVLGGILMGYGARLAFGCNIGGMVAGIVSGSLHGWLWLIAGFCGAIAGTYLRVVFKQDPPMAKQHGTA